MPRPAPWLKPLLGSLLVCLMMGATACHFDFSFSVDSDDDSANSATQTTSAAANADAPEGAKAERAAAARELGYESLGDEDSMRVYYQYIDSKGGVRFVERLDDVPDEWRDRVGFVAMDSPPPMRPEDARKTWSADLNKVSVADARRPPGARGEIVLYYADWCGYCKLAKNHLDREGVDYDLRNVDRPAIGLELLEKTGSKSIPVLDLDGRILRGYSKPMYTAFLKTV